VELDRHFIERNDFSPARRGYDPDEVDRHLREIADAVNELKRTQRRSPSSLAAAAADQVRGIVEAAERSAGEIQEQAESEAKRIVDDATRRAREAREKADSDAVERVQKAEEASGRLLERTGSVESELDRLLGDVRGAASALVDNLRTSSSQLSQELVSIREEFEGVREARLEPRGREAAADEPSAVEPEPAAVEAEAAAVDAPAVEEEEDTAVEAEEVALETETGTETEPEAELEVDEVEAEPEPEPIAEAPSTGGRSIRGAEGARLIALNMALNGTPRDETARYLSQNFDLEDQDSLLDEVYARVSG
jgi:DivIVA domain-containing protein